LKIERTKNAVKGIAFGSILKIYQIIVPFIMRTVLLYFLGVEYLGLNSLFTSVLQVLNLAELGIGSAMVFSMYKPIAEDDEVTICALMKLYKLYYRIIGWVILIVGGALCPFIPYLIKSDLPEGMNVYILYLLNLGATVLSYWLFAYKSSLFQAHQRTDIISKINIIVSTVQYFLQFLGIMIFKNYYVYVMLALLGQLGLNVTTAIMANKKYPSLKAKGTVDKSLVKQINRRVKDLFTAKVGSVIVNSVDTIVISAFLGLTVLAVYQNYYYILSAVIGIVGVIFRACSAGVGNSLVVETEEKNYIDLKRFTFIIVWISTFCVTSLLCLFQTFMELWVGKKYLLEFSAVICFCVYYFIYEINTLLNSYKDAAGIWHKDRFRPLVTALTNLALNLILVRYIGIYGVLLSTVLSTVFIGFPWLTYNLFTEVFKKKPKEYLIKLLKYVITAVLLSAITYWICEFLEGVSIITLILKAIICVFVPNILFFLLYNRCDEMEYVKGLVLKLKKK
jgi:O-antigen/teichoic acid export membrane protein